MKNIVIAILIFLPGELFALVLFYAVRRSFKMERNNWAIIGGILERLILLSGLYMGITQIVAMFGVFKVAAQIKPSDNSEAKKSNDYFLIGNLLSVFLALIYYWTYLRLRVN